MAKIKTFLDAMWPILRIMRLLGWFPVRRERDKLELSLIWCFVSVFIVSLQCIPSSILIYRGFQVIPHQKKGVYLFSFLLIADVLLCQIMTLLTIKQTTVHLMLCRSFTKLQQCLSRKSTHCPSTINFHGLWRYSRIIPGIIVLPFVLNQIVRPILGHRLPSMGMDFFLGLSTAYVLLLLTWWHVIMHSFAECSRALLAHYKSMITEHYIIISTLQPQIILSYRLTWLHMCDLLRDSSNVFAATFRLLLTLIVASLSYCVYGLLLFMDLQVTLYQITYTSLFLAALSIFSAAGHKAATQIYRDIMEAGTFTEQVAIPHRVKCQMRRFFLHLTNRSPKVTLREYVTVGRELVYQVLPALITNVALLVQMHSAHSQMDSDTFFAVGEFITYSGN